MRQALYTFLFLLGFSTLQAQTQVYNIPLAGLINQGTTCGNSGQYNGCNNLSIGFSWTDVLPVGTTITAVNIQFRIGVECAPISRTVSLNNVAQASFTTLNNCNCNIVTFNPITSFNAAVNNYVRGGYNQITMPSANCLGFYPNWSGGTVYAIVTVSYSAACAAPSTQASNLSFSSVGANSMNINWANGSGGGRVVIMNTTNSFSAPANTTNPTANTVYGGSGQQVVFNGSGSGPVTITGLLPNTNYFYRVYEYCTPARYYQTTSTAGNPGSQVTASLWYLDADNDNYYSTTQGAFSSPGAGWSTTAPAGGGGDCNDANAAINPAATEIPGNGIDEDCNGSDLTSAFCGSWSHYRTITLSAPTPSANYQVKVTLNAGQYANMQAAGNDLRFTDASGTPCDYYIETWNNTGTSTIWVEAATSGTSGLVLFYGNPSAAAGSNGDATFLFFDSFGGGSLDAAKWDAKTGGGSSVVVSGGELTLNSGTTDGQGAQVIAKTGLSVSSGFILESTMGTGGSSPATLCGTRASYGGVTSLSGSSTYFSLDNPDNSQYACWSAGRNGFVTNSNIIRSAGASTYSANLPVTSAGQVVGTAVETGRAEFFRAGSSIFSTTTQVPTGTVYPVLNYMRYSCHPAGSVALSIAEVRVRKFLNTYNPTATLGAQQTLNCDRTWNGSASTAWNTPGNWTPAAVPASGSNVIIPDVANDPVITSNVTVNDLTLAPSATLTVAGSASLTLNGTFTNNGATVIQHNGQFMQGSGSSYGGSGTFTVEKTLSNAALGYRNISSPVNTTVADLADDLTLQGQDGVNCWYSYSPYPNVQVYDEAANNNLSTPAGNYYTGWISKTGTSNAMQPMQGFAVRKTSSSGAFGAIDLTGTPNNGPYSISVTKTTSATPLQDGWNFTGNPYPSSINWQTVASLNSGKITGSYYVFNTTGEYTGNWGTCNSSGVCSGIGGLTKIIAPMQGFFVQATGNNTFTMNNTVRETTAANFYKTDELTNELRLTLTDGVNSDEILTYTEASATAGYDIGLDAQKIPAGSPVYLSYPINGTEYVINAMDEITESTVLPIIIWAQDTGTYTFEATELNVDGYITYLKDAELNTLTDLTTTPSVTLQLNGQQAYEGRYSIVFEVVEVEEPSGITNINEGGIKIYSHNNIAVIERPTDTRATITISNTIGQTIKEVVTDSKRTEITLDNTNAWYAIVKVKEANAIRSQKVMIK